MNKPTSLKPDEDQDCGSQPVWSLAMYSLDLFERTVDPGRKRNRKTDVRYAKYQVEVVASVLASRGPKSLDEAALVRHHHYRFEELPAFMSEAGSKDDWRWSSRFISRLSLILMPLICSTDKGDARDPDIFETLGMLAYLQTRIAEAIELAGPGWIWAEQGH